MTERIREIAFDTETTGLDPDQGDRVIELGAVELMNHVPTGRTFRRLINPEREVSEATIRITGLTDDMLADKPLFSDPDIVDALIEFIDDATIVAHNARFDRGFLNMELNRCGKPIYPDERWVDTLHLARKQFPGAPASLDALCRRFDVSLEGRTLHGALLDAQLLADVYLELRGGRARAFAFENQADVGHTVDAQPALQRSAPLPSLLSEAERAAHSAFVEKLGDKAIWSRFRET